MDFEKTPRFSFPPDEPDESAWIEEASRIIEEENWEDDPVVMEIHSNVRDRIEQLGDQPKLTPGGSLEIFDRFEKEETLAYVQSYPERAAHYAELWDNWAKLAGLNPDIEDNEWRLWQQHHPQAEYMGQYRAIARAYREMNT